MAYSPELLAQVLGLGGIDHQQEILQRQMAQAAALRGQRSAPRSTPLGAALGGLAEAGAALGGGLLEADAQRQMAGLERQRVAGREAFVRGVQQADQQGRQREAGTLIVDHPALPFAGDEYSAEGETLRKSLAREGRAERQRDARGLALLSGDPALRAYADSLKPDNSEAAMALRELGLEQGAERLRLAQGAEQRKAFALEKSLGLKEQQMKAKKEEDERKAAAKKIADSLNMEEGLRKEVVNSKTYKDYVEASIGMDKVARAASDNSPAGDIALVFGLMKTLDPGSTVREGEQAQASQATNVPGQVLNFYNRVVTGTRLTPEQRADFTRTARNQFGAYESAFNRHLEFYKGVGTRAGANLQNIIPGSIPAPAMPATPAVTAPVPAQPVDSEELRAAETWLKANPGHEDAPAVRERIDQLRRGGGR